MADLSKITCPDGTTVDILSKTTRGIVRGIMNDSSSTSTSFVISAPGINSLYDGATFICKNTKVASDAGCVMNVNGLGAKGMWCSQSNTAVTTHWTKNYTYIWVYDATNERWEFYQGRDTDNNDTYTISEYYKHVIAGTNGIKKYSLFAETTEGYFTSFITNDGIGAKTFDTTTEFDISKLYHFNSDTTIAANATTADNTVRYCGLNVNMRYNFTGVTTSASTSSLTANKPLYLVITPAEGTFGKITSPYFIQDISTNGVTGVVYVRIGWMRNSYYCDLEPENKAYIKWINPDDNTDVRILPWVPSTFNAAQIGKRSTVEGYDTIAIANQAHAEGTSWTVNNVKHHTVASANAAHAEGGGTTASGNESHAEGVLSVASGDKSHCEGYNGQAIAPTSHVEGYECIAYADNSHAEGAHTTTGINGTQIFNAHAEGNTTTASGNDSHAEGSYTTASGYASHAEGARRNVGTEESPVYMGKATGYASHSEGYGCDATGLCSHAEGGKTTASGSASHAEGDGTIAAGDNQHVSGRFNVADNNSDYAEVIGNGTNDSNRSNARTLDWDGNEVLYGTTSPTLNFVAKATDLTVSNNGVSADTHSGTYYHDVNGKAMAKITGVAYANGRTGLELYAKNWNTSGTDQGNNTLSLYIDKSGNKTVGVNAPQAWLDALTRTTPTTSPQNVFNLIGRDGVVDHTIRYFLINCSSSLNGFKIVIELPSNNWGKYRFETIGTANRTYFHNEVFVTTNGSNAIDACGYRDLNSTFTTASGCDAISTTYLTWTVDKANRKLTSNMIPKYGMCMVMCHCGTAISSLVKVTTIESN